MTDPQNFTREHALALIMRHVAPTEHAHWRVIYWQLLRMFRSDPGLKHVALEDLEEHAHAEAVRMCAFAPELEFSSATAGALTLALIRAGAFAGTDRGRFAGCNVAQLQPDQASQLGGLLTALVDSGWTVKPAEELAFYELAGVAPT